MVLYMAVTADKYELPMMVTENIVMLAERYHTTTDNVYSAISKNNSGKITGVKFVRVEVEGV